MPDGNRAGAAHRRARARIDDVTDSRVGVDDDVALGATRRGQRPLVEGQLHHRHLPMLGVREGDRPGTLRGARRHGHLSPKVNEPGARLTLLGTPHPLERRALAKAAGVKPHVGAARGRAPFGINHDMLKAGPGLGLGDGIGMRHVARVAKGPRVDESTDRRVEGPLRGPVPGRDLVEQHARALGQRQPGVDRLPIERTQHAVIPPGAELRLRLLDHPHHPLELRDTDLPVGGFGDERRHGAHQEHGALDADGGRGRLARGGEAQERAEKAARCDGPHSDRRAGPGRAVSGVPVGSRLTRYPITRWTL